MGSKPKQPKPTAEETFLRQQQVNELIKLDEEENARIKRLFAASRGLRVFRGSPSSRQGPRDTVGSTPRMAGGRGAAGAGSAGMRVGGMRGGRSLIP